MEITKEDPIWEKLISEYGIKIPDNLSERLCDIKFVKMDTRVVGSGREYVPICFPPIMVTKKHALNLSFPLTAISKHGEVIRIKDLEVVSNYLPSIDTHYCTTSVYDPILDEYRDVVTHRMVGLTWLTNDAYFSKCVLNHKDGNKLNPSLSNLEWVTQSENHLHAIREGLRQDILDCRVLDTVEDKIYIFPSYGQAKKFLGLKRLGNSDFIDGKFITKDRRFEVTAFIQEIERASTKRQKFKVIREDEVHIIPSLRKTAEFLNTVRSVVKRVVEQSSEFNGWKVEKVIC